jgi:hypothetical protein
MRDGRRLKNLSRTRNAARLGAKEAATTQHRLIFERLAESYDKLAHDTEWLEGTASLMNIPQSENAGAH